MPLDLEGLGRITGRTALQFSTVSLADEMAFAALPDEVQALARRVLGDRSGADAIEAYERGFEDGVEACDIDRPGTPSAERIRERLAQH